MCAIRFRSTATLAPFRSHRGSRILAGAFEVGSYLRVETDGGTRSLCAEANPGKENPLVIEGISATVAMSALSRSAERDSWSCAPGCV